MKELSYIYYLFVESKNLILYISFKEIFKFSLFSFEYFFFNRII